MRKIRNVDKQLKVLQYVLLETRSVRYMMGLMD